MSMIVPGRRSTIGAGAQHRASIILAISSGAAKITAARSPIMPAGMIAGTSFSGPSLLESVTAAGYVALLGHHGGQESARRKRDYHERPHRGPALSPERRYLTSAAAARTKTMTANSQNSPMPHIIPGIISFIMVHLTWLARNALRCID
jgi:hypothetical protein